MTSRPPGVCAHHGDFERGEILGAAHAEAGLSGVVALVVLADQLAPARVEEDHVTLLDRPDALALHGAFDLGTVEGRAFLHDIGAEVARHVEEHAARAAWR
jgi:hypothetical protein